MYDYIIVGAGLYGASMANMLHELGYNILVVEKHHDIGGMCQDVKVDDFYVHLHGAHIFHTSNDRVWDFVNRFATFNNFINSPKASYNGKLYSLPFNMNTFYELFGARTAFEAKRAIERDRVPCENPANLEEHILDIAGKTIYETLVKHYTEKQWGKSCKELPASHIKRLPFRFVFDNNYFDDKYQGIPTEGYTNMIRNMLKGIKVELEFDFCEHRNLEWCMINCRRQIIYTGSIDDIMQRKYGRLTYRSLHFETFLLQDADVQSNAVLNWTGPEFKQTRTIEHKHFMKNSTSPRTVITYEYPEQYDGTNERYYPIDSVDNDELRRLYREHIPEKIFFGGRLGKFKYFDMDDVIEEAMKDLKVIIR